MIPYTLLGSIALFILLARNSERLHAVVSALLTVGAPLMLDIITFWIAYGTEQTQGRFLHPTVFITVALQLVVAWIIFRGLKLSADNNFTAFFAWVAIGWPSIFLLVPFVVGKLL